MLPTIEQLRTSTLSICYSDETLAELLAQARVDGAVKTLLSLMMGDARHVCAGMMSRAQLVEWSAFSARRAKDYATYVNSSNAYSSYAAYDCAACAAAATAYAYAAAGANAYSSYAAYDCAAAAAYAAAYAAAACAAESASKADHEIAIRDACRLLGWS